MTHHKKNQRKQFFECLVSSHYVNAQSSKVSAIRFMRSIGLKSHINEGYNGYFLWLEMALLSSFLSPDTLYYQPCSVYGKHGSSFASYVTSTKNVVIFIAHNGVKPFLNSYSNSWKPALNQNFTRIILLNIIKHPIMEQQGTESVYHKQVVPCMPTFFLVSFNRKLQPHGGVNCQNLQGKKWA
jgi:hypothetical protein